MLGLLRSMTWRLAWRNLLRRRRRTLLAGGMVALAAVVLVLGHAFAGSVSAALADALALGLTGHVQLHPAGSGAPADPLAFQRCPAPALGEDPLVEQILESDPEVVGWSRRLQSAGLLSRGDRSTAVLLLGVDTDREPGVTTKLELVEGRALRPGNREVLLSRTLARKLRVQPGQELTALASTPAGYPSGLPLTVVGLYRVSGPSALGEIVALTDRAALAELLEVPMSLFHHYALRLAPGSDARGATTRLEQTLERSGSPGRAYPWQELGGLAASAVAVNGLMVSFMNGVILLVAAVGIANAFSMGLWERLRELGTLRAMGMERSEVAGLFLAESLLQAVLFGLLGTAIGLGLVLVGSRVGIPALSEAMSYGFGGDRLFLRLEPGGILIPLVVVLLFNLVAVLPSAWAAARLPPVRALRSRG